MFDIGDFKEMFEWLRLGQKFWEFFGTPRLPPQQKPHPSDSGAELQQIDQADSPGQILLLGPGGVGKTTLARVLSADYRMLLEDPGHYEESIDVERFQLASGDDVELVVLPGQRHRRDATWKDVLKDVDHGRIRGIIFVSSFGYHSLGAISFKSHRLYAPAGKKKSAFLKAFLDDCRREELENLKELEP